MHYSYYIIHKLFTNNVYLIPKLDYETEYTNNIDDVDFQPEKNEWDFDCKILISGLSSCLLFRMNESDIVIMWHLVVGYKKFYERHLRCKSHIYSCKKIDLICTEKNL